MRDELVERLVAAAQQAYDDRTVTFLSGGTDSRAILAAVRRAGHPTPPTATWGDVEGGPKSDAAVARRIARRFGLPHLEISRDWDAAASAFVEPTVSKPRAERPKRAVVRSGARSSSSCMRANLARRPGVLSACPTPPPLPRLLPAPSSP